MAYGGNTFGGNKYGGKKIGGNRFGGKKFGASAPKKEETKKPKFQLLNKDVMDDLTTPPKRTGMAARMPRKTPSVSTGPDKSKPTGMAARMPRGGIGGGAMGSTAAAATKPAAKPKAVAPKAKAASPKKSAYVPKAASKAHDSRGQVGDFYLQAAGGYGSDWFKRKKK